MKDDEFDSILGIIDREEYHGLIDPPNNHILKIVGIAVTVIIFIGWYYLTRW